MTMPIPDGSVVITPAQMYRQIGDLADAVRDLKGAVDPALADMRHDVADHEARLRAMEQRRYVSPASLAWAVGTAIVALGVLVSFLAIVLHR